MEQVKAAERPFAKDEWALILGASSGIGLATAKKLAAHGLNLLLVHRDRQGVMPRVEQDFEKLRESGVNIKCLNLDALSPDGFETVIENLKVAMQGQGNLRLVLHSIAYGSLKPLIANSCDEKALHQEDLATTIYSMGTNLLFWVQRLHQEHLFAGDSRVIGLTSEGNQIAWRNYAAVSAAKCALESICRSIAVEFGSYGIRCNVIQAGVTDTPALRYIPNHERLVEMSILRNPSKRLTRPEDVANAVYLLTLDEASWINGTVIRVDGGEHIGS